MFITIIKQIHMFITIVKQIHTFCVGTIFPNELCGLLLKCSIKLTNNAVEKYVYLYDRANWDSIKDVIVSLMKILLILTLLVLKLWMSCYEVQESYCTV